MTEQDMKNLITGLLKQIAPETEPEKLLPGDNIRVKLGIDSFDALRFLVAVSEKTGVSIPEEDYGKTATMAEILEYIKGEKGKINGEK